MLDTSAAATGTGKTWKRIAITAVVVVAAAAVALPAYLAGVRQGEVKAAAQTARPYPSPLIALPDIPPPEVLVAAGVDEDKIGGVVPTLAERRLAGRIGGCTGIRMSASVALKCSSTVGGVSTGAGENRPRHHDLSELGHV